MANYTIRITVKLTAEERKALDALARDELRTIHDQARWLLHQALLQHGYLKPTEDAEKK